MKLVVVVEADPRKDARYTWESFNLDIFKNFFDEIILLGHIKGADFYTEHINGPKFSMEGRKILRKLNEKDDLAVYSAPIYWGPMMTKGLKIKNFVRYGLSINSLKLCDKNNCNHIHYIRYILANLSRHYFWASENTYFLPVCKAMEKELLSFGIKKNRITQIYHIPKLNKNIKSKPKNHSFIFISDTLSNKIKRPEMIIDALTLLKAQDKAIYEKIKVRFVGYDHEFILNKSKTVREKLILNNPVYLSKLMKFYSEAYFGLHPAYVEGLPRVILEGMACGLPFIASPVGGIPELVDNDTGSLFESPEELAEKISYFIENEKIRKKLSKNCRKRIVAMEKPIMQQYKDLFNKMGIL